MSSKHNIVYKTTNKLNGMIYIGVHSTDDIDDGYLGSGKLIKEAISVYGAKNFDREILGEFNDYSEALEFERALVNTNFIKQDNVYNLKVGGYGGFDHIRGTVTVKDSDGVIYQVPVDDPRYISKELVHITSGLVVVKTSSGEIKQVAIDCPEYISGEYVSVNKGRACVRGKDGRFIILDDCDPRIKSGEFCGAMRGKVVVKDSEGIISVVSITDTRYASGELVPHRTNTKLSDETKNKIREKGRLRVGVLNSQYGTCWVCKEDTGENKKIKRCDIDLFISLGWKPGRIIRRGA